MMNAPLFDPVYQQTALIVFSIVILSGVVVFSFRKKNFYFISAWASIKSWLIAGPLLFIMLGLPEPWSLICLVLLAVYGAKAYFQILGMFHRSYFVLICYAGLVGLGLACYHD